MRGEPAAVAVLLSVHALGACASAPQSRPQEFRPPLTAGTAREYANDFQTVWNAARAVVARAPREAKAEISAIAVKKARGDTSTFFLARGRRPPGRRRHGKARGEGSGVRVVAADADSWSCLQTFKQVLLLEL